MTAPLARYRGGFQPLHGTVTAVQPLTVKVDGASTASHAILLAGYSPAVGDVVALLPYRGRQLLVLGAEMGGWSRPIFSGYSSVGQALAAGENIIQVNTVVVDTRGEFNTGTYAYTCPVAGVYRVSGQCKNSTQIVGETQIYHNGAVAKRGAYINSNVAQGGVVTALLVCAAGDTLQLAYWMNAAATAQDDGGTGQSLYFDIEWVGAA